MPEQTFQVRQFDKLWDMNNGRRAYDLLRGYVNQEWERIRGVPESDAETELNQAMATARVRSDRTSPAPSEVQHADPQEWARSILGVSPTANFDEIRKVYLRLNSRSNPGKFPEGSIEARQASDIQLRVQKAYAVLTECTDSTEMRFKSLEID